MTTALIAAVMAGGAAVLALLQRRLRRARRARLDERYALRSGSPRASARAGGSRAEEDGGGSATGALLGLLLRGSAEVLGAAVALLRSSGDNDPDGLLTILFCDVEDSTSLNLRLGDARWADVVQSIHTVAGEVVSGRQGRVVKTQGDGFMAVFGCVEDAVLASVGLQEAITDNPRIGEVMQLRLGLHRGEVVGRDGDVFGTEVVKAARIADLAAGGEALASVEVRTQAAEVEGAAFELARRRVRLKGLPDRHDLYRVLVA